MHPILPAFIASPPRNHMHMHVRHALARGLAILHGHVERVRAVHPLQRALEPPHGQEEVRGFVRREVGEVRFDGERGDEDVAGEEGFEVHEREGVRG
ncbi:hypothetical protein Tdes44962_MAKER06835 [Teratosphaeria destructans]|uniref:Uncharacterized protein n=1 Tax=Teratosphaeria destructans TaxID=418781 RepID=A0A9W7T0N1_9PEZI|nr:hypothetical protein Tdes44962_MAKER06835 [Teratosphaeria destructans]